MTVSRSARGQRSDKRLVAIAVAAGILLAACGDDSDGTGGTSDIGDGVAARNAEMEAASSANITQWDGCDVFSDHMHEFAEFLGYLRFDRDLQSGNGDATSGILMCYGDAVVAEDDALEAMDFEVEIFFGFGTASQVGVTLAPEEYQTPTGRYDQVLQLRREGYDPDTLAERSDDGPWDEAIVLLGDTNRTTTLSAYILDTERDFMIELIADLDNSEFRDRHADQVTWTLLELGQHFRDVTMPNAYQEMADRVDAAT